MLVQSGSGQVYAVLANNDEFELSIMPTMAMQSTTVFLSLRCRFKSLKTDYFNPMLVPKPILVGGIERSENTLRGTILLNSGFTVDKVGSGFPELMAKKLVKAAPEILLPLSSETEKAALYLPNLREDFVEHFAQLVGSAIGMIYPAKDYSGVPALVNTFDAMIYMNQAAENGPASPFAVVAGKDKEDTGASVKKLTFVGGDDEPAPDQSGVDKPGAGTEGSKVHLFGQAPTETPAEPETTE